MNKIILLLFTVCLSFTAYSQDFPFGQYTSEEMAMTRYDKDTSAHAVVLREFGKAFMDNDNFLTINFIHHVKIKIFDSRGYNEGDIIVRVFKDEAVKNIAGTTVYKDNKGITKQSYLDTEKVYREEVDSDHIAIKFALPNLHDNCIIEYTYTTTSTYHFNFHSWKFQTDIPKIYSEYDTQIPGFYRYNIRLRGALKLSKNETWIEHGCMDLGSTEANCVRTKYAMDNIPAFVKEEYTTTSSNYLSGLYFELYETINSEGVKTTYTNEWSKIDYNLRTGERFGVQTEHKGLLKDVIPRDILSITDTLIKAQAIYAFVQKQFKFNGDYNKYSENGIESAMHKHSGSVGDINLTLIALLKTAGINTNPVILSTVDNGIVSKAYPTISDFNYVVARVNIYGKNYLLDATDPLLAFGLLPVRCINDQGRVIMPGKSSYWINLETPDKYKTITSFDMTLLNDGKITGIITKYSFGYAAYNQRTAIKKFNTVNEFIENMDESLPTVKILRSDISNLDSLNLPLIEIYNIEINNADKFNHERVEFIPSFWSRITRNPFILAQRNYPVFLGYTTDEKVMLTMHLPDSFEITDHPIGLDVALPEKGGSFSTAFQSNPGIFNYSEQLKLDKITYSPEEYPYLKELYNKLIQTQKATIIFEKKQ